MLIFSLIYHIKHILSTTYSQVSMACITFIIFTHETIPHANESLQCNIPFSFELGLPV